MEKAVSLDTSEALVVAPDLSILPMLRLAPQLEPFREAAANLAAQAERALIDSEGAYQKGSDFETICQQQWDQLEVLRKAVKGPVDDYGKLIQSIFLPIQQSLKASKTSVNTKRLAFYKAEQARQEAAAAAARKATEEAALRLAEERQSAGDAAGAEAIMQVATMAPATKPAMKLGGTNTFGKSTNLAKRWTATVQDPMEVLRQILAGHIPISVIDWKQVELNKVATQLKVERTVWGLKVYQSESLGQR